MVGPALGLGVVSASNTASQQLEAFGTNFSSPLVANIITQIFEKYIGISFSLLQALLMSSCTPMTNSNYGSFSETIQSFGKVDSVLAVNSQEWRVCYLIQGEFDKRNKDEYHRYSFLFPSNADELGVNVSCGKFHTVYNEEHNDYVQLHFTRPGIKPNTPLKKGTRIGPRKCCGAYKEKITISRGSRDRWILDVLPHFSNIPIEQRIKYSIVITLISSKMSDIYSQVCKWVEPQKERLLVPAIAR